ncbi:MAG: hypothetical protein IKF36_02735 [Bacilli bacterium]|nr:hypothetical protein [Bacilli bacterium]
MNNKIKILIGVLLVAIISILAIVLIPKNKEYGDIESFTYNFGSGEGSYYEFNINIENDKYIFTGKGYSSSDLNIKKELSTSDMKELSNIIKDNNITSWDGFDREKKDILDGDSFKLIVKYKNGEKIVANGYMLYPDNYREASKKLEEFLFKISGIEE